MHAYGLLAYNSSKPKGAHMLEAKPSAVQKMVDMSPDRRSATFWKKNVGLCLIIFIGISSVF